jgi:hypothetical protein
MGCSAILSNTSWTRRMDVVQGRKRDTTCGSSSYMIEAPVRQGRSCAHGVPPGVGAKVRGTTALGLRWLLAQHGRARRASMPLVRATLDPSVPSIGSMVTPKQTRHQLESWVGKDQSVAKKGEGASGASFSPLRRNIEQVTGTVVTGRMCNSWVAPLLLAAVQQSILGATSSTRQGAAAATLGEDEDAVSTVFPPSAARYSGSMAVSTSWAQHGATTGRSAGDVGAAASPARRRRRGARPQLLGGDAGSRGPRASSLPPALPLPSPTSSLPRFLVEAMDLDRGAVPQGGGGGTGRAGGLEGI